MRHLLRGRDGYIDPIMSVLPLAALLILFVNPRLVAIVGEGWPDGLRAWARVLAMATIVILVQGVAIAVCLAEAHQDARSGGERSGFNRAPALQGLAPPLVLALVYIAGLWPLIRVEPRPMWAIVLNAVLAAVLIGGGLVADQRGGRPSAPTG